MGNTSSSEQSSSSAPPSTPASSFFNLANPPTRHRRKSSTQGQVAYPRRSIFANDEDEPDDFCTTPRDEVLLGWTRTEAGIIIPQIRSFAMPTPLDDTIFNSPRLPWVEAGKRRAQSPVPSARSIRMMRQFSVESFPSVVRRRELKVVNASRPTSMEFCYEGDEEEEEEGGEEVYWEGIQRSKPRERYTFDEEEECEETLRSVSLKRGNSTNDSGYSTMVPDTASCDSSDISEDPWWWEEAAGYSTSIFNDETFYTQHPHVNEQEIHYLHEERQESAYLSTLLRTHPFDEWAEWRTNVTKLLMIPEEDESPTSHRPVTPVNTIVDPTDTPRSPTRRRSLFNFAKVTKNIGLNKRKSVL